MAHMLLIHHKVADFKKWKPVFDEHQQTRKTAGLKDVNLWHNLDDPNDVILLFEATDLAKAKQFMASADLKEAMKRAGVVGAPSIVMMTS